MKMQWLHDIIQAIYLVLNNLALEWSVYCSCVAALPMQYMYSSSQCPLHVMKAVSSCEDHDSDMLNWPVNHGFLGFGARNIVRHEEGGSSQVKPEARGEETRKSSIFHHVMSHHHFKCINPAWFMFPSRSKLSLLVSAVVARLQTQILNCFDEQ